MICYLQLDLGEKTGKRNGEWESKNKGRVKWKRGKEGVIG